MATIFSIDFTYRNQVYYALISSRQVNEKLFYRITIMNGKLEQLISGYNNIEVINGKLVVDDCGGNKVVSDLKTQIVHALAIHLKTEVLTESLHDQ